MRSRRARYRSRRSGGGYKRLRLNRGLIFGVIGGVATVMVLLVGLFVLVTGQNAEKCKTIGLKGGIASCEVNERLSYSEIYLVVGNVANSPVPELNEKERAYIINTLYDPSNEDARLTIMSAPSASEVINRYSHITNEDIEDIDSKDGKELTDEIDRKVAYLENLLDQISEDIKSEPRGNHVDYLSAIENATSSADGKTLIIVKGSGISDSGDLDFTDDTLNRLISDDNLESIVADENFLRIANDERKNMKGISLY